MSMGDAFVITSLRCGQKHGEWRCDPGVRVSRKASLYEFIWIRQGKAICRLGGKSRAVGADEIILLRPGQTVKWEFNSEAQSVLYAFGFDVSSVPDFWPQEGKWPFSRKLIPNDVLRPLFEYVVQHGAQCDQAVAPAVASAVEMMVVAFISETARHGHALLQRYPAPIHRVLQWMTEFMVLTPGQKVTLDDLATVSGVCSTHLCRLFHDHVGKGPLELLYMLRVTRALVGLGHGQKVESLAYQLGFTNASHFARRFKAFFGKSPSQMQKLLAKGYKPKMPKLPLMS